MCVLQQLAKVVEGWKRRQMEKDEYLKEVVRDKQEMEATLQRQQAVRYHGNFHCLIRIQA
jgi:hypothetical protein